MDIQILQLIDGAKQSKGLTVVIDVFRAFSLACYAMDKGAAQMIPVAEIEEAYILKEKHPEYILIGERDGVIQPGFDYGNSPTQIEQVDLDNKTIVHTTSAGTQGIIHAQPHADEVITGSFVNVQAIIDYIRSRNPQQVSLVCMGLGGIKEADEDTLCANYIKNALEDNSNDFAHMVQYLRSESKTGSFLDVKGDASAPKEDFDKCLSLDKFNFVLRVESQDGMVYLRKVND